MRTFLILFILVVAGFLAYLQIGREQSVEHDGIKAELSSQIAQTRREEAEHRATRDAEIAERLDDMALANEKRFDELSLLIASIVDKSPAETEQELKETGDKAVDKTIKDLAEEKHDEKVTKEEQEEVKPKTDDTVESYNKRTASIVGGKVTEAAGRVRDRAANEPNPEMQRDLTEVADCLDSSVSGMPAVSDEKGAESLSKSARDCHNKVKTLQRKINRSIAENREEFHKLQCDVTPDPKDEARCKELDEEYERLQDHKKEVDHAAMMMKMFMMWLAVVLILSGNVAAGVMILQMINSDSGNEGGSKKTKGECDPARDPSCTDDRTAPQPPPPPPAVPCEQGDPNCGQRPPVPAPPPIPVPGPGGNAKLFPGADGLFLVYDNDGTRERLFAWTLPDALRASSLSGLNMSSFNGETMCDRISGPRLFCRNLTTPAGRLDHIVITFSGEAITDAQQYTCPAYLAEFPEENPPSFSCN